MTLTEAIVAIILGILTLAGTWVTAQNRAKDGKPPLTNQQVHDAELPDARALRMMLDQQERIDSLEQWRKQNEPLLASFRDLLIGLAAKLRARIQWRAAGAPPPPPHTDEEMLEEIEALIPTERQHP